MMMKGEKERTRRKKANVYIQRCMFFFATFSLVLRQLDDEERVREREESRICSINDLQLSIFILENLFRWDNCCMIEHRSLNLIRVGEKPFSPLMDYCCSINMLRV